MFDKGYGVVLSQCKFREDAPVILMQRFGLENDEILEQFHDFCGNYGHNMDDPDAMREFVGIYEDDFVGCDLGGLLARVINDAEFGGAEYFITRDCCLYVSAAVPVDDEDRKAMPTQKEIQSYLAAYMAPLLKEPAVIDWVEVEE